MKLQILQLSILTGATLCCLPRDASAADWRLDAPDGSPTNAVVIDDSGGTYVRGGIDVTGSAWIHGNMQVEGSAFVPSGNFGIGTTTPSARLNVKTADSNSFVRLTTANGFGHEFEYWDILGNASANSDGTTLTFAGQRWTGSSYQTVAALHLTPSGNIGMGTSTPQSKLDVNGDVRVAGKIITTTLELTSDRNQKHRFQPVSPAEVLAKVSALPISTWRYTNSPDSHMGPMAQDFHAAFGLGEGDKHISVVDGLGVSLAAIQGLNAKLMESLEAKDAQIAALRQELKTLKAEQSAFASRFDQLERLMTRTSGAHAPAPTAEAR